MKLFFDNFGNKTEVIFGARSKGNIEIISGLNIGDIINVDVTVILDGWYGDSSRMFVAGKPNKKHLDLLITTYEM